MGIELCVSRCARDECAIITYFGRLHCVFVALKWILNIITKFDEGDKKCFRRSSQRIRHILWRTQIGLRSDLVFKLSWI